MQVASQLATAFHGAVRHDQLLAHGLTPGQIKQLARTRALHRRHRGVYIVGHLALAPMADEAAALLACGERSVISHRSAACLWGLVDRPPVIVEVTIVGRRCRRRDGLRIHKIAALSSSDVRRKEGIRVTSPARTIVDLAAETGDIELEALIAEGRATRILRDGELESALRRAGKQKGTARLKRMLQSEAGRAMTRSETERICRRLLQAAGLPQPKTNRRLGPYEVDFLWPDERVVLEVDSYGFHGDRRAFERDRRKTMVLEDAGYHVIRITRRQLLEEPYWVVAHIARVLDRYRRPAA
jgi:very-short-patch-repair endonuclease